VLPARGCDARKCVNTSGPPDGLNIHLHRGGEVKPSIWKLKLNSVQPEPCEICGAERRWGIGKGRFNFCDEHNTWKMYFFIQYRGTSKS